MAREWGKALARPRQPEVASLYVHIPFCHRKCRYCVYYSKGSPSGSEVKAFLKRLHAEIAHYSPAFEGTKFDTWSLGGGTPTLLDPPDLDRLLTRLRRAFTPKEGASLEFETSPFTATPERIRVFEEHGFTRVSFGVQTFAPETLRAVRRGYQKDSHVERCAKLLLAAGFQVNLDLLYDLPGGGVERTLSDAAAAMALRPQSVVIYPLSASTPSLPGRSLKEPFDALFDRLRAVAAGMGYKASCDWFSIRLDIDQAQAVKPKSSLASYDDVRPRPLHLLALGPSSRGHIGGSLAYSHDPYPLDAPFSKKAAIAQGWRLSEEDEMRLYMVRTLSRFNSLRPAEFEAAYGRRLLSLFGQDLASLVRLGALVERDGAFVHSGTRNRRAAELFLLGKSICSALEQSLDRRASPRPGPDQGELRAALDDGIRAFGAGRQAEARKFFEKAARLDAGRAPEAFQSLIELSGGFHSARQAAAKLKAFKDLDTRPLTRAADRVQQLLQDGIKALIRGEKRQARGLLREASKFDRKGASDLGKAARTSKDLWDFLKTAPRSAMGEELDLQPLKAALAKTLLLCREGLACVIRGDRSKASRLFRQAVRIDPGGIGAPLMDAASSSASLQAVLDILKNHPRGNLLDPGPLRAALADIRRLNDEGIRAFHAGDLAGAEASFTKSLSLDPRDPSALLSLGAMAASQGKAAKALAFYERIAKPDLKGDVLAGTAGSKARLYRSLGKPSLAAQALKEALAEPSLPEPRRRELAAMLAGQDLS